MKSNEPSEIVGNHMHTYVGNHPHIIGPTYEFIGKLAATYRKKLANESM